jgi:hypothetical protein
MDNFNKSLLSPLIYYDLLDRPLTALEAYKYQPKNSESLTLSFAQFRKILRNYSSLKNQLAEKNGLYFLMNRSEISETRSSRLKIAQLKWKKLRVISNYLALVPFLKLISVTGSLTSYNTKKQSDFDLLVIIQKNRLWLGRLLLTGLVGALGRRRHNQLTQDRVCLNCYLTEENLEITTEAKPRDWHSAQEYGRLTPVLENKKGIYANFIKANAWLANFLKNYPWPNNVNAKKTEPNIILNFIRKVFERFLGGKAGDWLEKTTGRWQRKRIRKKRQNEQSDVDQVFVSNDCLMFHPQSKSDRLMREFNLKMQQLN